jgi:phage-related protein
MAAAETDKVLGDLVNEMRSENNVHAQAQDDWATEELIILGNVNDHLEVIQDWTSKMFASFQGLESSFKPSETHTAFLKSISTSGEGILKVLGNILNLQLDDSAAAREAAREAARGAKGGDEKSGVPDAKVAEAKAGGFFSKLGMAVMNPMKALGSGLTKIGKGIEGLLSGIARGIMAFANPLVLVGITVLSISLPIFAAGLAAAFKVFEMIAGEGKALELVTGIIESLGKAIGGILKDVLEGFGNMVKNMGPFITAFFDGLATVVKALAPIVTSFFKMIKDIITDPVLNKTIQAVLKLIESAIKSVERVLIAFAPYIEKIMKVVGKVIVKVFGIIKEIITDPVLNKTIQAVLKVVGKAIKSVERILVAFAPVIKSIFNDVRDVIIAVAGTIENIVKTIGSVISRILDSFDNIVNQIKPIIEQIGKTIETIINAIGDNIAKIGKAIEGVFTSIGAAVTKVIGAIEALVKQIGDTIVKIIDGVVSGIERLAGLGAGNLIGVAAGLTALAAALMLFSVGAALAGAIMPSRATLEGIAKSVEMFGNIPAANLSAVGKGMTDIGIGLAVFGAGGKLAELLKTEEGGLESVAKSVKMFGEIPASNLAMVGDGMTKVGVGLTAFGVGGFLVDLLLPKNSSGMESVAKSVQMFGSIDATNFAMVGDGIKKLGIGLAAFGGGGAVSALGDAFSGWVSGDKEDPVDKFKKFAEIGPGVKDAADGISGLAKAFDLFNAADPEKAGAAVNAFANSIDPAAISKLKDSFAGLSSEALFKGGVYKLEPVLGKFETGGSVPASGTYHLEKDEMVIDNAAVTMLVQGAQAITAMQTGVELDGLQRESNQLIEGGGAPIIVNSPTTNQINQAGGTSVMLPPSPIIPGNHEIASTLD